MIPLERLDKAPCTESETAKPNIPKTASSEAIGIPILSATMHTATKLSTTLITVRKKLRSVKSTFSLSSSLSIGPINALITAWQTRKMTSAEIMLPTVSLPTEKLRIS